MKKVRAIRAFAEKWLTIFTAEKFDAQRVETSMGEDCAALGFVMDRGHLADEKSASIIESVTDVDALGSAIYSQWRFYQYWACSPWDVQWFVVALRQLAQLTK